MTQLRELVGHLMSIQYRSYDLFRCELRIKHPQGGPSGVIQGALSIF